MSKRQTPAHWSKDFVEHLRTVHFTLIALCLGLIILSSFRSETEIERAHEQVAQILKVTNAWDANLFEDAATKIIQADASKGTRGFVVLDDKQSIATIDYEMESQYPGSYKDWFKPQWKYPTWITKLEIPDELLQHKSYNSSPRLQVMAPTSIRSFQRLWDSLLAEGWLAVPTAPRGCVIVNGESGSETWSFDFQRDVVLKPCSAVPPEASHNAHSLTLEFRKSDSRITDLVAARQRVGKWDYEFSAISGGEAVGHTVVSAIILPVTKLEEIEFDGQEVLLQRAPPWTKERKRPFRDVFRELASVDGAFENVDISSAERILAEEAKREVNVFEAMGLKIPADLAVRWGVLLVFGVQLYMWIHLYEFGNRLERDAGFDVAWIGVYLSKPAQVLLVASLLALPWFTVIVLSYRGIVTSHDKTAPWTVAVLANAASLALSVLIFRVLPRRASPNAVSPSPSRTPD